MSLSQHLFDLQFGKSVHAAPDLSSIWINCVAITRYVQRTTEGHYTARDISSSAESNPQVLIEKPRALVDSATDTEPDPAPEATWGEPITGPDHERGSASQAPSLSSKTPSLSSKAPFLPLKAPSSRGPSPVSPTDSLDPRGIIEQLKSNQDQTNHALKDAVENVTRMMIKLHNHFARVSKPVQYAVTLF